MRARSNASQEGVRPCDRREPLPVHADRRIGIPQVLIDLVAGWRRDGVDGLMNQEEEAP